MIRNPASGHRGLLKFAAAVLAALVLAGVGSPATLLAVAVILLALTWAP